MMRVLFQNHSSLLLQYRDRYLLTDPWYNQPAFGSWLPTFAPYIHPAYLASLSDKLTILVSHGHDDHFDDRLLRIFNKDTKFVTADFKSPSVINRLKKLGFTNIETVGEGDKDIDGLLISSFVVEEISHDDASYLIRNEEGAVIHANDNWNVFKKEHEQILINRLSVYKNSDVLFFSQTNSASGYPLNYRNFTDDEKIDLLKNKVVKMVEGGLTNAKTLGLNKMFSYAGFATAYVKNRNYHEVGLFPTASCLKKLLDEQSIQSDVEICQLYPGDSVELPSGKIIKAFVNGYTDEKIKAATDSFYDNYNYKTECLSYQNIEFVDEVLEDWIELFLSEFNSFSVQRVSGRDSHFCDLLGKKFSIEVSLNEGANICKTIKFGDGLVDWDEKANKVCYVDASLLYAILKGDALFEDLDTGYNAEWARFPSDVYNRDITMMITMFSYVYKNRLSSKFAEIYT